MPGTLFYTGTLQQRVVGQQNDMGYVPCNCRAQKEMKTEMKKERGETVLHAEVPCTGTHALTKSVCMKYNAADDQGTHK